MFEWKFLQFLKISYFVVFKILEATTESNELRMFKTDTNLNKADDDILRA